MDELEAVEKPKSPRGNSYKHGHRYNKYGLPTLEYNSWSGLKGRILNTRDKLYPYYGGRGLTMCSGWDSFEVFLSDVGLSPSPQHSLDRVDNSIGYFPNNVRWATRTQQSRNRRNNIVVFWEGDEKVLSEFCEDKGWKYKTVWRWYIKEFNTYHEIKKKAEVLW
jgi:hypothetical protein